MRILTRAAAPLLIIIFFAGCSSPRDRFIDAAAAGSANKKAAMECVADKLQKQLSPEEFEEITNDLVKINKKEMTPLGANLKLMGLMGIATLACKF